MIPPVIDQIQTDIETPRLEEVWNVSSDGDTMTHQTHGALVRHTATALPQ